MSYRAHIYRWANFKTTVGRQIILDVVARPYRNRKYAHMPGYPEIRTCMDALTRP